MLLTRKCGGTDRDRVKGRGYQNWLQCYDGKFVVPIFLTKRRILQGKDCQRHPCPSIKPCNLICNQRFEIC